MSAAGSAGAGGFGAAGSASVGSAGAAGAPGFGGASGSTGAALGGALFSEVGSLAAADSPEQLVYAASYSTLLAREVSGRIDVVDLATGQSTARMPTSQFVDMSLSPDGRYLYASDYGGENIGYSTPFSPSYVHRLDLADRSWAVKAAYIAGNIQVTSSDQFVLGTLDQWITFTLSSWGVGLDVTQLNSLYAGVYSGDFRFDPRTQRLIHGNAGLSSQEIQAFEIVDQQIEVREGSGTYGSASGYGPSVALATDGSVFYYGALSVDAQDVTHNLRVFPEAIRAAFADIAFGQNAYYDAHTGSGISNLGFYGSVYGLNPSGGDFWVYDAGAERLRHLAPRTSTSGADAGAP